jgi:hypothetical protein
MVTAPFKIIENGNVGWTQEADLLWAAIAADKPWPPQAPEPVVEPAPIPTPVIQLPTPSEVSVLVLNGTSTNGQARRVASSLENLGFNVSDYGNSSARPLVTEVRYAPANVLQAKALIAAIGIGTLVPDVSVTTGVNLVIGKNWTTLSSSPTPTPTPTLTPTPSPTPTPTITSESVQASDNSCLNIT